MWRAERGEWNAEGNHEGSAKRSATRGAAIADKAVKQWHATSFSNGKRRVYVTFEEVRTVSA